MLEVSDLEVRYGAIRAVRGVSVSVAEGELAVLLGANGAGKSSTLKAIAGALRPTRGRITLDGAEVPYGWPERMVRLGAAMVPETRDVFPDLTVAENLRLGAFTRRRDPAGVAEDHARVVDLFPVLGARAGQPAGTLSGGEQQMLVIARALMSRPRPLLLDEPAAGMNEVETGRLLELLTELPKAQRLGLLIIDHDMRLIMRLCHRLHVLASGRTIAEGDVLSVQRSPAVIAAYLGSAAADA